VTPVYRICLAYESGFGHGLSGDAVVNPYALNSPEHEAYAIGHARGTEKRMQAEAGPAPGPLSDTRP
jgi:hypothetical protein